MNGNDGASSSIEWHDSPKFAPDNRSTLRSKLPQVKRLESEQKFNADFDKWFAMGNEGDDVCLSRRSDETANDDIDVTPPVLRIRYGTLRPHSSRASSSTPTGFSSNDSDIDEASGLTDVLKEAKKTIRRLIEKKRHTSSSSSPPRTHSPNGVQIKATARVVKDKDVAHESNLSKEESRVVEMEVKVIGKSSCCSEGDVKSNALGPCTSSQIGNAVGEDVNRRLIDFGNGGQEPSPIISVGSRKRKRKKLTKAMRRKGDDMEVSTSSDEDVGPVESTPLSSHRASTVHEHIERISASSSSLGGGNEEGIAYDSMDDETVNVLLSQIPIEPHLHQPKRGCPESGDARPLPENIVISQSFQKDNYATSKPKICVTKKIHNERTPLRRWRTCDASPQGDMKAGGWSRRMTAIAAAGSNASHEKAEDGGEAMPRSASFEPQKCDSFWDDDEFEGVDFSAIDAVQ